MRLQGSWRRISLKNNRKYAVSIVWPWWVSGNLLPLYPLPFGCTAYYSRNYSICCNSYFLARMTPCHWMATYKIQISISRTFLESKFRNLEDCDPVIERYSKKVNDLENGHLLIFKLAKNKVPKNFLSWYLKNP